MLHTHGSVSQNSRSSLVPTAFTTAGTTPSFRSLGLVSHLFMAGVRVVRNVVHELIASVGDQSTAYTKCMTEQGTKVQHEVTT